MEYSDKAKPLAAGKAKENRNIITPYAFQVADDLLGIPLATPFRRACALLADLVFVAFLSDVSSVFLTVLAAVTFLIARHNVKYQSGAKTKRMLFTGLAGLMLLLFVFQVVQLRKLDVVGSPDQQNGTQANETDSVGEVSATEAVALTLKYAAKSIENFSAIESGDCEVAKTCWQKVTDELAVDLATNHIKPRDARSLLEKLTQQAQENLSEQELEHLYTSSWQVYEQHSKTIKEQENEFEGNLSDPDVQDDSKVPLDNDVVEGGQEQQYNYSIVEQVKSLASEFGLGFGWAVFYFTVLTAWLNGQTIGKKLMGIKVIKLDGSTLTLWESFGRYGGYGAGLATGLTGFLQIYWDANRQAIHDKISETLVIDTKRNKIKLRKTQDGQSSKSSDSSP